MPSPFPRLFELNRDLLLFLSSIELFLESDLFLRKIRAVSVSLSEIISQS